EETEALAVLESVPSCRQRVDESLEDRQRRPQLVPDDAQERRPVHVGAGQRPTATGVEDADDDDCEGEARGDRGWEPVRRLRRGATAKLIRTLLDHQRPSRWKRRPCPNDTLTGDARRSVLRRQRRDPRLQLVRHWCDRRSDSL